jgi:hypothetical protein
LLILSCKKRVSGVKFKKYSAKAPHIDGSSVLNPKDDLGGSVEPTLNVGINSLIFVSSTPEVNNFYPRFIYVPQQNILRLQISVDDLVLVHK